MIRTILIDDETHAREAMTELLRLYCENVEVIDQASNVKTGIQSIKQKKPDLVFLDIRMPDGTGFDLLRKIGEVDFKLIFVTAHEEYALQAFKFSAIDYLLKPVDPDELIAAISKIEKTIDKEHLGEKVEHLLKHLDKFVKSPSNRKIILKTLENIHIINTDDIIKIESDINYSRFFLADGQAILVSQTLKKYLAALDGLHFLRVHRKYIVNLQHVRRFNREDLVCVMKDGSEVPVSSRHRDEMIKIFKTL